MAERPPSPRRKPSKPGGQDEDRKAVREWSRLSSLAFEFLGYLAVLGYIGHRLDERNQWNGKGLFIGLMVGMAAWIYRVLRVSTDMFDKDKKK